MPWAPGLLTRLVGAPLPNKERDPFLAASLVLELLPQVAANAFTSAMSIRQS